MGSYSSLLAQTMPSVSTVTISHSGEMYCSFVSGTIYREFEMTLYNYQLMQI